MIHKLLELLGREQFLQFGIDRLHPFHVLGTRETLLTKTGILEVHPIDGIKANGIFDSQLAHKAHRLLESLFLGSALQTLTGRLLSHSNAP
ncbi:MAG: hypothetical protein J6Y00_08595 [Paludibacteraceae bacterium]|nr:hypothetical protein [Paludibacteraceae bacterium]